MSIIVFDTETTGLLAVSAADIQYQPYLVEIQAFKLNEALNIVGGLNLRCKPPILIPEQAIKVHGITNEMVAEEPPFSAVYLKIAEFFVGCEVLVGHNLFYDKMVLWYELIRMGKQTNFPWSIKGVDTVEVCSQYYGHRKSLMDLHIELFGVGFTGAHSASADCQVTMKCFIEMKRREMV